MVLLFTRVEVNNTSYGWRWKPAGLVAVSVIFYYLRTQSNYPPLPRALCA